jgi:hypothetical protein
MKTNKIIAIAALAGLLFVSPAVVSTASANGNSTETPVSAAKKLSVLQVKPLQFRVVYAEPQSKSVLVRILDLDRNILFSENKKVEDNYLKFFDLSTLLDGTYTFELIDGKDKVSQTFDISTKTNRSASIIK